MAFNRDAAKKAGYTDKEIDSYLKQKSSKIQQADAMKSNALGLPDFSPDEANYKGAKLIENLPYITGGLGAAVSAPSGFALAPLTGGGGAMAGVVLRDLLRPKGLQSPGKALGEGISDVGAVAMVGELLGLGSQLVAGAKDKVGGLLNKAKSGAQQKAAQQIVNQTPSQVRLNEQGKNKLAQETTELFQSGELKPGDYQSIRTQTKELYKPIEAKLKTAVAVKGNPMASTKKLMKPIDDLITSANKAGNPTEAKALTNFKQSIIDKWAKGKNQPTGWVSASDVLDLKRTLDGALSESSFSKSPSDLGAARAKGQRALGNSARQWLKSKVGVAEEVLSKESTLIQLKKAMEMQLKRAGGAPLKGSSIGGLNILNQLGKVVSAPAQSPTVLSNILKSQPVSGQSASTRIPPKNILDLITGRQYLR